MATAVGLVAVGVSFVEITAKSTLSLIKLLERYKNHNKNVLDLRKELESLSRLLQELKEVAITNPADSAQLELPLQECSRACEDFKTLITKCITHFDNEKTSVRDWTKLTIKEDDVLALKGVIGGYKCTISIVLGCINLRTSRGTIDGLQKWQQTIENTVTGLEELLRKTEERHHALSVYEFFVPDTDVVRRDRLHAEKDALQKCLAICAQSASETKLHMQSMINAKNRAENEHSIKLLSLQCMLETYEEYQRCQKNAASSCEARLQEVNKELAAIGRSMRNLSQQREKDSLQSCVETCFRAHEEARKKQADLFEDIEACPNAFQAIVHGTKEQTTARRVKAGQAASQILGSLSEAVLLQLAKGRTPMRQESSAPETMQTQFTESSQPECTFASGDEHSHSTLSLSQEKREGPKKISGSRALKCLWAKFRSS